MIAHAPWLSTRTPADGASSAAPIAEADAAAAAAAARRGITVITTVAALVRLAPDSLRARARAHATENLRRPCAHGVRVAIGSDDVDGTSAEEAAYLRGLGVWDDAALLRAWSMDTPRAIFPGRRIGSLADGHEASFLALGGDPLADWSNVRRVRLRFKQGRLLPHP